MTQVVPAEVGDAGCVQGGLEYSRDEIVGVHWGLTVATCEYPRAIKTARQNAKNFDYAIM